jgi:hypothetical protein
MPKKIWKVLNIIRQQGNAKQNYNEIPLTSVQMAIKKTNADEDVEKKELLYIVGGNVN